MAAAALHALRSAVTVAPGWRRGAWTARRCLGACAHWRSGADRTCKLTLPSFRHAAPAVFLERQFADFRAKESEEKMIDILQKVRETRRVPCSFLPCAHSTRRASATGAFHGPSARVQSAAARCKRTAPTAHRADCAAGPCRVLSLSPDVEEDEPQGAGGGPVAQAGARGGGARGQGAGRVSSPRQWQHR